MTTAQLTYSVREAAALIGIGLTKFYSLVHSGEIEIIKIGTRSLVPRASLENLVERCRKAA